MPRAPRWYSPTSARRCRETHRRAASAAVGPDGPGVGVSHGWHNSRDIEQTGGDSLATVRQEGTPNELTLTQSSYDHQAKVTQLGFATTPWSARPARATLPTSTRTAPTTARWSPSTELALTDCRPRAGSRRPASHLSHRPTAVRLHRFGRKPAIRHCPRPKLKQADASVRSSLPDNQLRGSGAARFLDFSIQKISFKIK